jgi:cell division septation protein DedD
MSDASETYSEQLPWLEAVDDEDGPPGVSARKMFVALLLVLGAALLVAGTFYWLGRSSPAADGAPELIQAEPGPYKVRPSDPGGLDVSGDSHTAYETSAGEDPDAQLNLSAVPEAPIVQPQAARPAPARDQAQPAPVAAAEEEPAEARAGSGSVVQLGAYRSAAQAQRGWDALSARFPVLAGTTKLIIPYSGGFRLRAGAASAENARQICQVLRVAGESCFVAN